jgi:hypothetical protein
MSFCFKEGTIKCVHNDCFFISGFGSGVWCDSCLSRDDRNSWKIYFDNTKADIEILEDSPYSVTATNDYSGIGLLTININNKETQTIMSKIISFVRNLSLSAEDKLLLELGLEEPTGVPTAEGFRVAQELMYQEMRAKVIEKAKAFKAEEDKRVGG